MQISLSGLFEFSHRQVSQLIGTPQKQGWLWPSLYNHTPSNPE